MLLYNYILVKSKRRVRTDTQKKLSQSTLSVGASNRRVIRPVLSCVTIAEPRGNANIKCTQATASPQLIPKSEHANGNNATPSPPHSDPVIVGKTVKEGTGRPIPATLVKGQGWPLLAFLAAQHSPVGARHTTLSTILVAPRREAPRKRKEESAGRIESATRSRELGRTSLPAKGRDEPALGRVPAPRRATCRRREGGGRLPVYLCSVHGSLINFDKSLS
jgi:hypothetical protein